MNLEKLENELVEALRLAATSLPKDVQEFLEKAYERETNPVGKAQLKAILDNVFYAREKKLPMCQDTGIQTFFVVAGYDFPHLKEVPKIIENAVIRATKEVPLRPNTVHPFLEKNPGNNTGRFIPYINWSFVEGSELKIYCLPKGGGSENMCTLAMLPPGKGLKGIKEFVVEHVYKMGGKPCPPTILGIGIGGGADIAMSLGKKAILRKLGERHPEDFVAKLELEILEAVNKLGIGPMGLGGDTTVLDVHIEYAHRHPASLPVGIVVQCWADRRAVVKVREDGDVEVVQ